MFEWFTKLFKRKTVIYVKKVHPNAVIPTQKQGDVGWDLSAIELKVLLPKKVTIIDTGIQLARDPTIKNEKWAVETKIESRSGLASKGIFVVGGVVDPNYRGNVYVCLYNSMSDYYTVRSGDRIAQLVLRPVLAITNSHHVSFQETDEQEGTERGDKGIGSSGR